MHIMTNLVNLTFYYFGDFVEFVIVRANLGVGAGNQRRDCSWSAGGLVRRGSADVPESGRRLSEVVS